MTNRQVPRSVTANAQYVTLLPSGIPVPSLPPLPRNIQPYLRDRSVGSYLAAAFSALSVLLTLTGSTAFPNV
ncbi:hypothetical protein EGT07_22760 [Herbaspirillum sp. HC18]|nr:hypothetical protein EGT07_22760 [Herbaspirillum sp. HC18]